MTSRSCVYQCQWFGVCILAVDKNGDLRWYLLLGACKSPRSMHRHLCLQSTSVCITSILRMTTLDTGSKNQDQTYGTLNSTIWTTIEANTGIICACLPMLKSPLAFLFPRLFPRNSYTDYSSRSDVVSRGPSRVTASRDGESPAAYDGWGRLQSQRPINLIRVPVPAKLSSDTSSDGTFGMSCQDIPMGHITKTVHVDVKYGDRNLCPPNPSPNGSQHSKERVRSISQVPLVGQDCHQFA